MHRCRSRAEFCHSSAQSLQKGIRRFFLSIEPQSLAESDSYGDGSRQKPAPRPCLMASLDPNRHYRSPAPAGDQGDSASQPAEAAVAGPRALRKQHQHPARFESFQAQPDALPGGSALPRHGDGVEPPDQETEQGNSKKRLAGQGTAASANTGVDDGRIEVTLVVGRQNGRAAARHPVHVVDSQLEDQDQRPADKKGRQAPEESCFQSLVLLADPQTSVPRGTRRRARSYA